MGGAGRGLVRISFYSQTILEKSRLHGFFNEHLLRDFLNIDVHY